MIKLWSLEVCTMRKWQRMKNILLYGNKKLSSKKKWKRNKKRSMLWSWKRNFNSWIMLSKAICKIRSKIIYWQREMICWKLGGMSTLPETKYQFWIYGYKRYVFIYAYICMCGDVSLLVLSTTFVFDHFSCRRTKEA